MGCLMGLFGLRPIWDDRNGESVVWQPPVNVYEDKDYLTIESSTSRD